MRWLIVSLLLVIGCFIAPSPTLAQSQREMNTKAGEDLGKADAELNKLYQRILQQRKGEPDFAEALKEGQRAWLKYVETHLKMLFFVKEGENPREVYGSIYPMEFAEAKATLIKTRIEQLKELLTE
jgi:uncharacterized protein YecT (DUF1311 family)